MRRQTTNPYADRPYPTRGAPAQPSSGSRGSLASRRDRWPRFGWLITPILLALLALGGSTATAARHTTPHAPRCAQATGAKWHIKHFYFTYGPTGALLFDHNGDPARLPASGNRYHVFTGAYCRLAHKWMHRLTSAEVDAGSGGHTYEGWLHVPNGAGLLLANADHPPGMVCMAQADQTGTVNENGDNLHVGNCVSHRSHQLAFLFTPVLPNPQKYRPR